MNGAIQEEEINARYLKQKGNNNINQSVNNKTRPSNIYLPLVLPSVH